ncbi:MAG: V-type ATPase subunit [Candidatus Omnitrophica bacterium]|nr:V-type ATPase subunit [Candidatus Omnitrophota bacterium]
MRELATYSFINAKIRAMISFLISPDLFSRMLEAEDVYKTMELLKESPYYKNAIESAPKEITDLRIVEKLFIKNDLDIYRRICRSAPGKTEKELMSLFIEKYELEQLKAALRIWNKKIAVNIDDFILGEKIIFDIDYKKIIYAPNIEEIILLLEDTPYRKPILSARNKFKEKGATFYLEASLDIDYCQRIFSCIKLLSPRDQEIAKSVIGIEIDTENINWLIRMRKYYSLAAGDILEWMIPGGARINKENVASLYTTDGLAKIVDSVALGPYAKIRELIEENMSFIENFLHEILLKEVKRALSGYPFTIGAILGYVVLKRNETKNIVSLLYAKNLGWKRDETNNLLNIC